MRPRSAHRLLAAAAIAFVMAADASAAPIAKPLCIAPTKQHGGFDRSCRLARSLLQGSPGLAGALDIAYLPGGIGAVAFNTIVYRRPAEPGTIVAFSGGSLLNLAQGKYGQHTARDVRWLASLGLDHGAVVVHRDSPLRTLRDLETALRSDPSRVPFGGGGTVGSQDWLKAATVLRRMGLDYRTMRFVSFEGGGEALSALRGRRVQVVWGDVAETLALIEEGAPIRMLAILAASRLPGALQTAPTAREQGYDVTWQVVRGFYMGPQVDDAAFRQWVELFRKTAQGPGFDEQVRAAGLVPFFRAGPELDAYVKATTAEYRQLVKGFGLRANVLPD